jgi:hypothetical protein
MPDVPSYAAEVDEVRFRRDRGADRDIVDIVINGRPLLELVRDAELADASAEGHPELAGKYVGLPAEVLASALFEGQATEVWAVLEASQRSNRVPLLICECGEPGCWPLMVTVTFGVEAVTWHDFRQPYRDDWQYEKLGPFEFGRAQYLAALQSAREA